MSKNIIEVDTRTFVRFWLVLITIALIIFFVYKAATGLILIGISIFLALALRPLVKKLNNFFLKHFGMDKSHEKMSAVFAYAIIVLIVGIIVAIIGPVVINETTKFVSQIPSAVSSDSEIWNTVNNFGNKFGIQNAREEIISTIQNLPSQLNIGNTIISGMGTIADIISKTVLILVLTLLFLLDGPKIMNSFWRIIGKRKEDKKIVGVAKTIITKMANVISTYVSHQVLVAILDGLACTVIVFVIALIFKLQPNLAIPMGLTAMIFYLVPMFGQIISACIVTLVLAFSNPIAAVVFLVVYIVYAQIENNLIAPKIQGGALKLPAVAILAAMVIGVYMSGLLGAIIAIPIAGCIRVLIEEYPNIKAARE